MKRISSILLSFLFFSNVILSAQPGFSSVTRFPRWSVRHFQIEMFGKTDKQSPELKDLYKGTDSLESFFNEWEQWSALISAGAQDSEYNDIFVKYFREYSEKWGMGKGKYIVLPERIKVEKYNCNIHPDSLHVLYSRKEELRAHNQVVLPESISYFTPKIEENRPVVYLIPEVQAMLDTFIANPWMAAKGRGTVAEGDMEASRARETMLREYVPVIMEHWGHGWFYTSTPLFEAMYIGKDGFRLDISHADYFGVELFVSWDGKVVVEEEWIQ